ARELAKSGIQKRQPDKIPTTCRPNSGIWGIRVTEITQSRAYKAIMEVKACNLEERPATKRNITAIKQYIQNKVGLQPSTSQVWLSIRPETMPRRIHNFYYLAIHQGQRIEYWWKHIPECSERQFCHKCPGTMETMSHILFECELLTQRTVWNLARTLF
ncbi:hypothetical protein C8J56DRAFT_713893, partial [Mycena floridula]